jgi:hypothetical protein
MRKFLLLATFLLMSLSAFAQNEASDIVSGWAREYRSNVFRNGAHGFIYVYPFENRVHLQYLGNNMLDDFILDHERLITALSTTRPERNQYRLKFTNQFREDFFLILDSSSLDIIGYEFKRGRTMHVKFPVKRWSPR